MTANGIAKYKVSESHESDGVEVQYATEKPSNIEIIRPTK